MTSKKLAEWVKQQREKKGLTLKDFHKEFNEFLVSKGSIRKRSYQWVTHLERYGEFAQEDLELINALVGSFGYRMVLLPKKNKIEDLTEEEKQEVNKIIEEENRTEKKNKEQLTQQNIINKNW